jgi:recombinational DNA repair protein RecR
MGLFNKNAARSTVPGYGPNTAQTTHIPYISHAKGPKSSPQLSGSIDKVFSELNNKCQQCVRVLVFFFFKFCVCVICSVSFTWFYMMFAFFSDVFIMTSSPGTYNNIFVLNSNNVCRFSWENMCVE